MPEVSASEVLQVPAAAVWSLLEDFGAIQRWWPKDGPAPILSVKVEGAGVGMVRHIWTSGKAGPVSERLDLLDASTRTLVLSIIGERPPGITAYVAEGRIVELGPTQCRINYRALVTTEHGCEEQVRKALLKTWTLMFRGLESSARSS